MGITATYSIQNLTPASTLHRELEGYYLTPETVKPIKTLLASTTGTERCLVPWWNLGCMTTSTSTVAQNSMVRFFKQIDTAINPHRLIPSNSTMQQAVHVLDPRIREVVRWFLKAPAGELYSVDEIEAASSQFAYVAQQSGLATFAKTSPCHTMDPKSLTCTWSNFPGSVDEAVWLKPGELIHPKLAGTYFTQRAAKSLRILLDRGENLVARDSLAELVLKVDREFSPYLMVPTNHIMMDGSVAAVESMIAHTPPASPSRPLSEGYTQVLHSIFKYKGTDYFSNAKVSKMICEVNKAPSPIADFACQITCSYVSTAADVL